jgi:hypothetical protein
MARRSVMSRRACPVASAAHRAADSRCGPAHHHHAARCRPVRPAQSPHIPFWSRSVCRDVGDGQGSLGVVCSLGLQPRPSAASTVEAGPGCGTRGRRRRVPGGVRVDLHQGTIKVPTFVKACRPRSTAGASPWMRGTRLRWPRAKSQRALGGVRRRKARRRAGAC